MGIDPVPAVRLRVRGKNPRQPMLYDCYDGNTLCAVKVVFFHHVLYFVFAHAVSGPISLFLGRFVFHGIHAGIQHLSRDFFLRSVSALAHPAQRAVVASGRCPQREHSPAAIFSNCHFLCRVFSIYSLTLAFP
jgi:hypothetical protein